MKIRYILISLVLLLGFINLQSQTFSFYRISDPVIYTNDSFGVISHARVNNLLGSTNQIRLIRTVVNVPEGWESCICDIVKCHPPGHDTAVGDYPPGLSVVDVMLYAHSIPGTGYVTIRAEKVSNTSENYTVTFGGAYNPIGIHQISSVVKEFNLRQNYPNPFNPTTKIHFSIPASDYVSLSVYDMLGRELAVLVNEKLKPGEYEVDFYSGGLASGMYYYRLRAGEYNSVRKMVLVK